MSFFRRALLSVTRRKAKSLIFLLVVLILGNVMLSTLLIVQSVEKTKDSVLQGLPPIVSLELDHEKLQQLFEEQYGPVDIEIPWLTYRELEEIETAAGAYIRSYDFSTSFYLETDSIEPFTPDDEGMGFGRPYGDDVYHYMIMGVNIPNFMLLEIEEAIIIEGRTFSESEIENGEPVLIVSKELADANNYRVGDTINIENQFADYSETGERTVFDTLEFDMELIGILEYREIPRPDNGGGHFPEAHYIDMEKKNTLITNNRFVAGYTEQSLQILRPYYEEMYGDDLYGAYDYNPLAGVPITYILHTSEDVDPFVSIANNAFQNEFYQFRTQEDNYRRVAEPLESMRGILTYAFYVTLGSAVVVLALILFGFMRDRQQEIGIYLALGEKKSRITAQMIVESAAIGLCGALLALGSGMFVARYISDMLLVMPQPDPYGEMSGFYYGGSYLSNINYESVIQGYQLSFSMTAVILFLAAIVGTIVIAQLIASVYILKFDPRKILM